MAEMEKRKRLSFEDRVDRLFSIMIVTIFGVVTAVVLAGGVYCVVSLIRWLAGN